MSKLWKRTLHCRWKSLFLWHLCCARTFKLIYWSMQPLLDIQKPKSPFWIERHCRNFSLENKQGPLLLFVCCTDSIAANFRQITQLCSINKSVNTSFRIEHFAHHVVSWNILATSCFWSDATKKEPYANTSVNPKSTTSSILKTLENNLNNKKLNHFWNLRFWLNGWNRNPWVYTSRIRLVHNFLDVWLALWYRQGVVCLILPITLGSFSVM